MSLIFVIFTITIGFPILDSDLLSKRADGRLPRTTQTHAFIFCFSQNSITSAYRVCSYSVFKSVLYETTTHVTQMTITQCQRTSAEISLSIVTVSLSTRNDRFELSYSPPPQCSYFQFIGISNIDLRDTS